MVLASVLHRLSSPDLLDKDPADGFGSSSEEMAAAVELLISNES